MPPLLSLLPYKQLSYQFAMISLFTRVTCSWSLQANRCLFFIALPPCSSSPHPTTITMSHPHLAMPAFLYTQVLLQLHPAFITTCEGGILVEPFGIWRWNEDGTKLPFNWQRVRGLCWPCKLGDLSCLHLKIYGIGSGTLASLSAR